MKHLSHLSAMKILCLISTLTMGLFVSGCSDDDDDNDDPIPQASFEVTVTNLTAAQPMSPPALTIHGNGWQAFTTGEAASVALEMLAESGDNSDLLASAGADAAVYDSAGGTGIVAPGTSETVSLSINRSQLGTSSLSVLSMLGNTNDAFAALNGESIASMAVDEQLSWNLLSYDAGTEANTESADTVPGPAAAGGVREGFNAARDDLRDEVHVHAGVVTQDDGLSTSALTAAQRWDNPVARVSIERIR